MEPKPNRGAWIVGLGAIVACLLIVGPIACSMSSARHTGERVELRYRFEWIVRRSGPPQSIPQLTDSVRRRLESLDSGEVRVRVERDEVVVRMDGIDPVRLPDARRLLGQTGFLELCPVADRAVQDQFKRDGTLPPGYRGVENKVRSFDAEYAPWSGPMLIIESRPALHGGHIIASEAQQELGLGGSMWVTTFELDADGARSFDAAAKILYHRSPAGLVAILLDGTLKSAPAVLSESFVGRVRISGAKSEQEAKELAIILKSGALPARLGRIKDGVFVPGEPQEERRFGPEKK